MRGATKVRGAALRLSALMGVALVGSACSGDRAPWNVEPPSESTADAVESALGPFPLPPAASPQERVNVSALGYDEGDPTARVTVVEFSDFGCGYCRRFHEATFPVLRDEFIASGQVRWKYVPFAIGMFPNGSEAALAGDCAGAQGGFQAMKARLYETQSEWRSTNDAFGLFTGFAGEQGLDQDRFAACLLSEGQQDRLAASNDIAARLGVRGTPTFFVQGLPVQGAIPVEMFRQILTRMVEETSAPQG